MKESNSVKAGTKWKSASGDILEWKKDLGFGDPLTFDSFLINGKNPSNEVCVNWFDFIDVTQTLNFDFRFLRSDVEVTVGS